MNIYIIYNKFSYPDKINMTHQSQLIISWLLKSGSLDLFHILHEVDRLKTEGARFFKKIIACLKTGKNDPE